MVKQAKEQTGTRLLSAKRSSLDDLLTFEVAESDSSNDFFSEKEFLVDVEL